MAFLILILTMITGFENVRPLEVEVDGVRHSGTYRATSGSVIVYWRSEVKFGAYGTTEPERVAQWLLRDRCLKDAATKREGAQTSFP